jgi:hypothetical protein
MIRYFPIPEHDDPPEWHFPLRLKLEPGSDLAKQVDLPREVQFVTQAGDTRLDTIVETAD